jgi:hypothetical protein
MHYCAEHDPQASRLVFILTSFRDVVGRQKVATSHGLHPGALPRPPPQHPSQALGNENIDPGMPISNKFFTASCRFHEFLTSVEDARGVWNS